jgi:hypothetical protein
VRGRTWHLKKGCTSIRVDDSEVCVVLLESNLGPGMILGIRDNIWHFFDKLFNCAP